MCLGHRRASTFEATEGGKGETHVRFSRTEERISRVVRGSGDSEIPEAGLTSEMGQMHLIKAR